MAQPLHSYKPVVFGLLEAFDPESDSVMAYLEWVDHFFTTNNIGLDEQVSVFLTVVEKELRPDQEFHSTYFATRKVL